MHQMSEMVQFVSSGYMMDDNKPFLNVKVVLKTIPLPLFQADNKRRVPAAAAQFPDGRTLLSAHLLQL